MLSLALSAVAVRLALHWADTFPYSGASEWRYFGIAIAAVIVAIGRSATTVLVCGFSHQGSAKCVAQQGNAGFAVADPPLAFLERGAETITPRVRSSSKSIVSATESPASAVTSGVTPAARMPVELTTAPRPNVIA
ncbi:hypothetical protein B2J88_49815 [Rhodococcus sp. SRB_17]|nr:hypothetical protein [Rhodococcus sp. SRB_17]